MVRVRWLAQDSYLDIPMLMWFFPSNFLFTNCGRQNQSEADGDGECLHEATVSATARGEHEAPLWDWEATSPWDASTHLALPSPCALALGPSHPCPVVAPSTSTRSLPQQNSRTEIMKTVWKKNLREEDASESFNNNVLQTFRFTVWLWMIQLSFLVCGMRLPLWLTLGSCICMSCYNNIWRVWWIRKWQFYIFQWHEELHNLFFFYLLLIIGYRFNLP